MKILQLYVPFSPTADVRLSLSSVASCLSCLRLLCLLIHRATGSYSVVDLLSWNWRVLLEGCAHSHAAKPSELSTEVLVQCYNPAQQKQQKGRPHKRKHLNIYKWIKLKQIRPDVNECKHHQTETLLVGSMGDREKKRELSSPLISVKAVRRKLLQVSIDLLPGCFKTGTGWNDWLYKMADRAMVASFWLFRNLTVVLSIIFPLLTVTGFWRSRKWVVLAIGILAVPTLPYFQLIRNGQRGGVWVGMERALLLKQGHLAGRCQASYLLTSYLCLQRSTFCLTLLTWVCPQVYLTQTASSFVLMYVIVIRDQKMTYIIITQIYALLYALL